MFGIRAKFVAPFADFTFSRLADDARRNCRYCDVKQLLIGQTIKPKFFPWPAMLTARVMVSWL